VFIPLKENKDDKVILKKEGIIFKDKLAKSVIEHSDQPKSLLCQVTKQSILFTYNNGATQMDSHTIELKRTYDEVKRINFDEPLKVVIEKLTIIK